MQSHVAASLSPLPHIAASMSPLSLFLSLSLSSLISLALFLCQGSALSLSLSLSGLRSLTLSLSVAPFPGIASIYFSPSLSPSLSSPLCPLRPFGRDFANTKSVFLILRLGVSASCWLCCSIELCCVSWCVLCVDVCVR